ncbi:hypothetical protein BDV98DRAFT_576980 [Pterulicium gracile]|uniref:Uncharacterized protein n=1 Tax=Pterulicium gracile TaxID=1884261 RepID=A0A5C3Q2Z1_9AGAR|nr:hypothetical protein BDV98DRAFT_576980 [Pterula gracilis]
MRTEYGLASSTKWWCRSAAIVQAMRDPGALRCWWASMRVWIWGPTPSQWNRRRQPEPTPYSSSYQCFPGRRASVPRPTLPSSRHRRAGPWRATVPALTPIPPLPGLAHPHSTVPSTASSSYPHAPDPAPSLNQSPSPSPPQNQWAPRSKASLRIHTSPHPPSTSTTELTAHFTATKNFRSHRDSEF